MDPLDVSRAGGDDDDEVVPPAGDEDEIMPVPLVENANNNHNDDDDQDDDADDEYEDDDDDDDEDDDNQVRYYMTRVELMAIRDSAEFVKSLDPNRTETEKDRIRTTMWETGMKHVAFHTYMQYCALTEFHLNQYFGQTQQPPF